MTSYLTKVIANFETTLASGVSAGDSSATLTSATDADGDTLPSARIGFTINEGTSDEEHIIATVSGTSLSSVQTIDRGTGAETANFALAHRKGANVKITNFQPLSKMMRLLDGTDGFDSGTPLYYDGNPTFNADAQIVTKKYVDDIAIAGAADASTTVKGISKMSVAPVSASDPIAVGDNDGRVPTQDENDAMQGSSGSPSSTNPYITENDTSNSASMTATTISFSDADPDTIADSGSGFVTAGFRAGQTITVSGSTSNDGTYTIASVVAGTITLDSGDSLTTESAGDSVTITAAVASKLARRDTNGQVPVPETPTADGHAASKKYVDDELAAVAGNYAVGTATRSMGASSGDQTIAHGLGATPSKVKITVAAGNTSSTEIYSFSWGAYDGTNTANVYRNQNANNQYTAGTSSSNIVTFRNPTNTSSTNITATIAVDSTNITLTWSAGVGSNDMYIMWEAEL